MTELGQKINITTKQLDLNNLPSMSFSEPISFRFSRFKLQEVNSWRDLYGKVIKHLCQKYADTVQSTLPKAEIGDLKASKKMKAPFWVRRGIYAETGLSTDVLLKRIKQLLNACKINWSDLKIVYFIDEDRKQTYAERVERKRSGPKVLQLRWDYIGTYKGSRPISFRYGNHRTRSVKSWSDLYAQFVSFLADEFPRVIKDGASFGDTRIDISEEGKKSNSMQHPVRIGHNLVLETLGTGSQLIDRMYGALILCKVNPDALIINFTFRDQYMVYRYIGQDTRIKVDSEVLTSSDARLLRRIRFLLNKYFENGYRIESTIDRSRFYSYYEDQYKEPLPIGEEELSNIFMGIAKPFYGRIMLKTQASIESLMKSVVQKAFETFSTGATCIYISEIMKLYQQELAANGIHDEKDFETLFLDFSENLYRMHYNS